MNLGPRRILSSGLVMVALMGGGGVLQSSGSVLASNLENGQQIYRFGVTAEGRMVENSHGMRGVGCAMCHGPDGRGGSMHGIPVPNITFSFLTDPEGYESDTGRRRPPYNEETFKAAVVAGIDSGGNTLHPEMPRWPGLTAKDLEDLLDYLKSMGKPKPPAPEEPYFL